MTFPSLVLCDLPHVQICQVLSLCYAIPTSLLLSRVRSARGGPPTSFLSSPLPPLPPMSATLSPQVPKIIFYMCVCAVWLRTYALSHSTSPFLWWVFQDRVSQTISLGGFELQSS
jgi:hypothetical protein